jgi:hypothetical protein
MSDHVIGEGKEIVERLFALAARVCTQSGDTEKIALLVKFHEYEIVKAYCLRQHGIFHGKIGGLVLIPRVYWQDHDS